ncbi:MAG: dTDP-glucose 4,6-dehydratase [Pirellulaceae bacterium]
MNSILVAGGAGFIGSCFVRQQLATGDCRVVVLDKLTYAGNLENLAEVRQHSHLVFQQGDIGDVPRVRHLLETYRPQWVINLAAESHVDRSIDEPLAFVTTNVLGTCQLLEACLDYWRGLAGDRQQDFRYLHVSTDEVFGSLDHDGLFTEQTPYAPNSPYAASKAAADHFVRAYHRTYALPTLVTHGTNNYGPYQYPEKLIPLVISRAVGDLDLPIYGDGSNVRDWLHVEDHCVGLRRAMESGEPGQAYLFGGQCERSNLQVVQTICEILDELRPRPDGLSRATQITFVEDRLGHDRRYAADIRKVRYALGWQPVHAFKPGLEETVRWYLAHADWVEQVRQSVYDGRRLGLRRT